MDWRVRQLIATTAVVLSLTAGTAQALQVYDPSNHTQNAKTAAEAVKQTKAAVDTLAEAQKILSALGLEGPLPTNTNAALLSRIEGALAGGIPNPQGWRLPTGQIPNFTSVSQGVDFITKSLFVEIPDDGSMIPRAETDHIRVTRERAHQEAIVDGFAISQAAQQSAQDATAAANMVIQRSAAAQNLQERLHINNEAIALLIAEMAQHRVLLASILEAQTSGDLKRLPVSVGIQADIPLLEDQSTLPPAE